MKNENTPKQTVTIGNTTLLVSEIVGWVVEVFSERATTYVHMRNHQTLSADGDQSAALDEAVNDPRRQWGLSSLAQSATHGAP